MRGPVHPSRVSGGPGKTGLQYRTLDFPPVPCLWTRSADGLIVPLAIIACDRTAGGDRRRWRCLGRPARERTRGESDLSAAVDFARDVQPLLAKHCYECHGAKKQESGLRLDQRAGAMAGGELGRDIVPHKSGDSRLVAALRGASEVISRMPPSAIRCRPSKSRWWSVGSTKEHNGPTSMQARPGRIPPTTGPSALRCVRRCRQPRTPPGRLTTSTGSCWRGWRPRTWRLRLRPTRRPCCGA